MFGYKGQFGADFFRRGAVAAIIAVNIAVFLVLHIFSGFKLLRFFGLVPAEIFSRLRLWQPVTYMFLHFNLWHLVLNMLMLWFFGPALEETWGQKRFLSYYFFTGIAAGLCSVLVSFGSFAPVIGASGAIFGLLVAFAFLYPEATVYLFLIFPMKMKHAVVVLAGINLLGAVSSQPDNIAYFAHLGGALFGYFYLKHEWFYFRFWRWAGSRFRRTKRKNKTRPLDEEVDAILDKVSRSGLDSLSARERAVLRRKSRQI